MNSVIQIAMNPWTITIVGGALVALLSKYLFDYKLSDHMVPEFTSDIREGLKKSKEVLRMVSSTGGMTQHPWYTEIGVVKEDEISDCLTRFHGRIKNKKVRLSVSKLQNDFRQLFANSVYRSPIVFIDEPWNDGKTPSERIEDNKKAERQLSAHDDARKQIESIEAHISLMEQRHSKRR